MPLLNNPTGCTDIAAIEGMMERFAHKAEFFKIVGEAERAQELEELVFSLLEVVEELRAEIEVNA
jgi:C4-type Zn-finger protein